MDHTLLQVLTTPAPTKTRRSKTAKAPKVPKPPKEPKAAKAPKEPKAKKVAEAKEFITKKDMLRRLGEKGISLDEDQIARFNKANNRRKRRMYDVLMGFA